MSARMSIRSIRSINAAYTRRFSLTARRMAKGDDSTIDFYKLPHANYVPREVGPSVKIPILPDNYGTSPVLNEHSAGKAKLTAEFEKPLLSHVSEQGTASSMADADILATTDAAGRTEGGKLPSHPDAFEELSQKDRSTLLVILGLVAGWWTLGNLVETTSTESH